MATLTKGKTFGATETVTNTKLHQLVDSGTVTNIALADFITGVRPITVSTGAPSSPTLGDGWSDTSKTVPFVKIYDGTNWNPDNDNSNYRSGLEVSRSSATALSISAGSVHIGRRNVSVRKTSATSLDIATSGDFISGSPAANQWVYAVIKADGTIKLTASAPSDSDADGTTTGKLQYRTISGALWRYLGVVRSNASTQLLNFERVGNRVHPVDATSVLSGGTATSLTAVDASAGVPPIAKLALLKVIRALAINGGAATDGTVQLRKTGGTATESITFGVSDLADIFNNHQHGYNDGSAGTNRFTNLSTSGQTPTGDRPVTSNMTVANYTPAVVTFPVNSSQSFDYRITNGGSVSIQVIGYIEDLD